VNIYTKRLVVVAVLFALSLGVGLLVTQEGGRVPLQAERLAQAGGVYEFTWSPDGATVAYIASTASGFDVWTVASTGGKPRQITTTQRFKKQLRWSTDGKWIAYVSMQDSGRGDIYLVSPDGSSNVPLAETTADEASPVWAPDSEQLAFIERTAAGPRLLVMDLQPRTLRELTSMDATNLQWSPNGQYIAFVADPLQLRRDERRDNLDIFIIPTRGGPVRLLTPGTPRFRDSSPSWSPDSKYIVYASEETGFSNLNIVDIENGEQRTLTLGKADSVAPRWSPDGARVAYVRNENFTFHVFTTDVEDGRTIRVSDRDGVNGGFSHDDNSSPRPLAPSGSIAWSPDGTRLAFTHSDPTRTPDIWIGKPGEPPLQLTNSMPQDLRREGRFVWPETLNYRSFDGREVSALVFKPRGSKPRSGHPALLVFRDTLDGQHASSWDPFVQFFVSNGYLVFAPNVRGSSGRGRDYRQLIAGYGGDHDIRDAFFGLDRLSSEGLIDTERLGVFGAGTGGFLTTASLVRDENRFKAAVCLYGIVDAVTAASYPGMAEWSGYLMGGSPIENPRPFFERSIVNFIDKLRTPVVFLYGGNDVAAPFQQLQQFAVQAEVKGKWYDYRVFEHELGDWRTWRASSLRLSLEAMNALFEKHLLGRDRDVRLSRNR
jgi:dipeptidyl aminopeptidase/acylaminoacyl peptidase